MRVKVQIDPWKVMQLQANLLLKEYGIKRAEGILKSRGRWRNARRLQLMKENRRIGDGVEL